MKTLELRQLKYFVGIVDAGSMMQASTRLYIAQPALSVQLAKLEAECGVQLLVRGPRGVTPTDAGSALYRHAVIMLKLAAETRDVVRRSREHMSGRVRLGMPADLSRLLAAALVKAVGQKAPGVVIQVHEHYVVEQVQQLQNDEVDVSLLVDLDPASAAVRQQPLFGERMVYLRSRAAAGAPLPAVLKLADAAAQPLVAMASPGYRAIVENALAGTGRPVQIVSEVTAGRTMIDLIADGFGAGIAPPSFMRGHRRAAEVEFCELDPAPQRQVRLGCSQLYPLSRPARLVCSVIAELLAEQVGAGLWHGTALEWTGAMDDAAATPDVAAGA